MRRLFWWAVSICLLSMVLVACQPLQPAEEIVQPLNTGRPGAGARIEPGGVYCAAADN